MPLYEFRCNSCGCQFEKILSSYTVGQKISCESCNSGDVKKAITAASYRLSGTGSSAPLGSMNRCASKPGFS